MIPLLRRIAEATGEPQALGRLASTLGLVDPGEAETLLRSIYHQASTSSDHSLASAAAGALVTLLQDQGRLRDALALADQQIEHTCQAGLGAWTQLGDYIRRLQILGQLGYHDKVLTDLSALRARMAQISHQPASNDFVEPWSVRETILGTGRSSALALRRWQQALDLTTEIITSERKRGATPHDTARTRFTCYGPLLNLGRLTEAEQLLCDCQNVFETASDIPMLGMVYGARADLEGKRGHVQDAVELQRSALRLSYIHPNPRDIAVSHHNLASCLSRVLMGNSADQHAHRLAAALLYHFTGDTHHFTVTLRVLATELRGNSPGPDAPPLPTTLSEVIGLVETGEGVRFSTLLTDLCPDPDAAERALADLLATAATLPDQPPEDTPDPGQDS
ncbi:MAG: hypothetical protein ACRDTF_13685 [Pseudonocardiaceae bacterium]